MDKRALATQATALIDTLIRESFMVFLAKEADDDEAMETHEGRAKQTRESLARVLEILVD